MRTAWECLKKVAGSHSKNPMPSDPSQTKAMSSLSKLLGQKHLTHQSYAMSQLKSFSEHNRPNDETKNVTIHEMLDCLQEGSHRDDGSVNESQASLSLHPAPIMQQTMELSQISFINILKNGKGEVL